VRDLRWNRAEIVDRVRDDVWRHLTQAAQNEPNVVLEAGALLRMPTAQVRELAYLHFILSDEVGGLLEEMPGLVRRLATTTVRDEERSAERIRGPIQWATTLGTRASTGVSLYYVTAPARRAYQTPENELLVEALESIRSAGKRTGWHKSSSPDIGVLIRDRVSQAERWLRVRMLGEIERRPVTARSIGRVRSGRSRRRYQAAIEVHAIYQRLLGRLDRGALRKVIEDHALITRSDDVLMELLCGFRIESALRGRGWETSRPGLVRGGALLRATRGLGRLTLFYQHTPRALSSGSRYAMIQKAHPFRRAGQLRPDFLFRLVTDGVVRWLLVEVKGGEQRNVAHYARAAALDLLAYRRAFDDVLTEGAETYGLGIAWGEELEPSGDAEICLCTPDTLPEALDAVGL
jgi:hypothetical protein